MEFCERQALLQTLYNGIKNKSKILAKKNVVSVEHTSTGVTVCCEDGTSYDGDLLAGADGVNSKTRDEMWRLAQSSCQDLVNRDRNC
jgi:2-polyprenyl-6-methoxyphenol hydroxylase-like FAD-dependent oxidoreductase